MRSDSLEAKEIKFWQNVGKYNNYIDLLEVKQFMKIKDPPLSYDA